VDIIWYIKKLNEDTIKNKRKFDKWIKTKLINIKKSWTKSKEKALEGLIWESGGLGMAF
jgi:hypothetical protein